MTVDLVGRFHPHVIFPATKQNTFCSSSSFAIVGAHHVRVIVVKTRNTLSPLAATTECPHRIKSLHTIQQQYSTAQVTNTCMMILFALFPLVQVNPTRSGARSQQCYPDELLLYYVDEDTPSKTIYTVDL